MKPGGAEAIEAELRRLEADPAVSKRAFRLYLQSPMPCGHAVADLLMCPDPPTGCAVCSGVSSTPHTFAFHRIGNQAVGDWPRNGRSFFCLDVDLAEACRFAARFGFDVRVCRRNGAIGIPCWELIAVPRETQEAR